MKNRYTRFACLIVLFLSMHGTSRATVETIPAGSFIINMGIVPQTYANGLKPWGMIHDLIKNYKVQIKWVINQSKLKDGIDFSYNGVDYKGGTFIIPVKYRTASVNARISYWQSQGVVGVTNPTPISLDVTYSLKYSPRWTFDFQNGSIAQDFLVDAGIPIAGYPMKFPSALNSCDDLFVMPHADPTWATHSNLYYWNQGNNGWIWAGCHAVSVLESLFNPANPSEKMNFLSLQGLVNYGDHDDGSPPYTYRYPTDPEMQFMGTTEVAQQNGSEQVFLPQTSSWRLSTQVAVYDPTQDDVPSLSPGEAAAIVYGRAFGVSSNGKVMYVGGHNVNKNNADAVSAMRNFFNFSFLSVYDKQINFNIIGNITLTSMNNYTYRVALPVTINPDLYSYQWSSTCGGTFSNPNDSVTLFTAPSMVNCQDCIIRCEIQDSCGRAYYQDYDVVVCPGGTLGVQLLSFNGSKSGDDNMVRWTLAANTEIKSFELEYSSDGNNFLNLRSIDAEISNDTKEYSFIHQRQNFTGYYRLKLINNDGSHKLSDVVVINRTGGKYIVYPIYPNPFDQQVTVSIDAEVNTTVDLFLADISGKIFSSKKAMLKKGNNKIELTQLGNLSPGTYFIRVSNEDKVNSMKLIKSGN